ncbi:MAG TPA: hypothetical protein VFS96_08215, partial [Nitrolancea sp.]|nr:hypothetical protein [Nitrolancea sp.]
MLINRYPVVNLFEMVPKRSADFAPELRELDRLLDDDLIVQRITADLAQRHPPHTNPRAPLHPGRGDPAHGGRH